MPKYIFATGSSDENYDANCGCGLVEIDELYAAHLLVLMNTAKQLEAEDNNLLRISYFDYSVQYFDLESTSAIEDEVIAGLYAGEIRELPEGVDIPEKLFQNIDVASVHVDGDDLFYEAIPKHTSITLTSPYFTRQFLEDVCQQTTK